MEKERDMVKMLERAINTSLPDRINSQDAVLLANNIFVQGQMWGFRRWILQKEFTLEEYMDSQIEFILKAVGLNESENMTETNKGGA